MTRWLPSAIAVLLVLALGAWALIVSDPEARGPSGTPVEGTASADTPASGPSARSDSPAAANHRPDVAAAPTGRQAATDATSSTDGSVADPLLAPQALIAQAGAALAKEEARAIFENPRPERRAAAIRERARIDRDGLALSARQLALGDPSPMVRRNAVQALGMLGEEEALEQILNDETADKAVRDEAGVALEDAIGFAKLEGLPVGDLIPFMRDEQLWWQAMELVAAANDPSVAGELWDIYFDTSQGFERREYALFVLDDLEIEIDEPLEALWIEEEQAELLQLRQSGALN